eukprot:CFRG2506T1
MSLPTQCKQGFITYYIACLVLYLTIPSVFVSSAVVKLQSEVLQVWKPDYCNSNEARTIISPLKQTSKGELLALKQVTILHRHGDRTPYAADNCWPHDTAVWECDLTTASVVVTRDEKKIPVSRLFKKIYDNNTEALPGNCAVGQLTSRGYKMHILNGKMLRTEYVDSGFVTDLNPRDVYLRVDDAPRTLQSLQAIVEGMFPPPEAPHSSIIPTIAIHSMDKAGDPIVITDRLCPSKAKKYSQEFDKSPAWRKHYNEITEPLLQELSILLDMNFTTMSQNNIFGLTDCLYTHLCFGYPVPVSLQDRDLYKRMTEEMLWLALQKNAYPNVAEASRVRTGFLLREWNDMLLRVINEKTYQKLSIFSGHDMTVIAVLQALGFVGFEWPKYGYVMQLELYQQISDRSTSTGTNLYFIRLILDGVVSHMPFCPPSEDNLCPFDDFAKKMDNISLSRAQQEDYCKQ